MSECLSSDTVQRKLLLKIKESDREDRPLVIFDCFESMAEHSRRQEIRANEAIRGLDALMTIIEGDEALDVKHIAGWDDWCFLTGRAMPVPPPAEEGAD